MLDLRCLRELTESHLDELNLPVRSFNLGGRELDFARGRYVMGVVNMSADSWYRESVCLNAEAAIRRGRVLAEQGAVLIDVGAESTLGHARRVDETAQITQLLPVVQGLRESGVLVSVETYQPRVAQTAIEAGAAVVNLTGTEDAETIYRVAADHGAGVIICYVQGRNVRDVGALEWDADPVGCMSDFFAREIECAMRCGLQRLFLDPGLGFYYPNLEDGATRVRHQMTAFLNTFRLRKLGWPICHALPHAFEYFREEVRCAEPFFAVLAALGGTALFRTHEVRRTLAVLETLAAFRP